MKEYIKKFESATSADNYSIVDIPFTTSIAPSSDYPSINYIQNLVCNQTGKKLVNNDGIVSIYNDEPVIHNDEIWYTSSDGNIVTPNDSSVLPEIDANTYSDGKGVIKFKTDVTRIGRNAFEDCSGLTSVTIPNSVTSIGDAAFSGCSSLTSVTIPNSVTNIGPEAFADCRSLTSVTIGNSVTSIGWGAFQNCSGLTSVTIPNSFTSIVDAAFSGCSSLTSVTIPNSVTSIGSHAFEGCSGLTSVKIPNSVTSIEDWAFEGCSSLTSVTIPNSVTSIGHWAFEYCSSLTSVTIGNSVTSIGSEAFRNCKGLTSITIPNSVTSIGGGAFEGCSGLTSVTCEATTPPTLTGYNTFYETNNCPIYVPFRSVIAYKYAQYWWEYASRIVGQAGIARVTIERVIGTSETITLSDGETYAEQGYSGYYSQSYYDSSMAETPEQFSVNDNYPVDGETIYDYCDDIYEPTDVEVTIEHEDGTSETITLSDGETYADQGYSGYYSQDTYDSNVETAEDYLVNDDYPYDGQIIYDYCSDDADPEPEDPDEL